MSDNSWFDTFEHITAAQTLEMPSLDELGILAITGDINEEKYNLIVAKIIMFNAALSHHPIHITMIVNSLGGWSHPTNGIIDFMEWSAVPIHTFGVGVCASAGIILLMTGEKGFRYCTNRTQFLSHHFAGSCSDGCYPQLLAGRKWEDQTYQLMVRHYSQHTNLKTEEEIRKYLLRDTDYWMPPEEAKEYGIVDHIVSDKKKIPTVTFPGLGDQADKKDKRKKK